ncbi:MAG: hypothetical protein HYU66_11905 [Armatimonadetes bacterium]|nr:hypothetical protein [Armatimonadota bacterium]
MNPARNNRLRLGAWLAVATLAVTVAWLCTRPRPLRVTVAAGPLALHYDVEFGPRQGLRDALIRRGLVPADALDDGLGRFVSPADLTAAERRAAAERVARREARRTRRTRRSSPPERGR